MPPNGDQLVIRQHERFHCRLDAHARVPDDLHEHVALARTVGDGTGNIDVVISDCSRGGLGLQSHIFIPRGCRLKVRLKNTAPDSTDPIEVLVRVQRVTMTDRAPTYYVGVSFVGTSPAHEKAVAALFEVAKSGQVAPPAKGVA